jgi:molybdopterin synthase catalytic subunit
MNFEITPTPINPTALRLSLANGTAGGFCSFEGWVRDHNEGQKVSSLEYEAYPALANKEGLRILDEARARFDIIDVVAVHRIGHLAIGDIAVWIGVSAAHRDAAFAACRFVIDEIKHRVPIWKREHYVTGPAAWVNCAACAEHGVHGAHGEPHKHAG